MGGSGTYNLRGSATLQTGTQITSPGGTYFIIVGSDADAGTSGTQGTLNISDSSKLTLNADSILTIGDATTILGSGAGLPASVQSVGVVNQTGSSTVVVDGGRISVGTYTGATGTYNLRSGTIQMTGGELDIASGATGATGVFNQSGGMITADGASSVFIGVLAPGATGSGTYNLSNGIADFDSGLEIGEIGSVNQTGGALTVAAGGTIDLSTAGGSYNLKGGSLTVGTDSLIGSAHEGHFNFGGGTLDTTGDLTDALDGTLSGNSTIHAAGTLILSGTVTGNGALTLTEGTLNASTVNLPQISGVTLRTGTAFNLTVSSNASNTVDTFTGKISGTGNLTTGGIRTSNEGTPIATPATGYRLILPNGVDLTGGTTTITANTALQVSGGTLNTITGGGSTTFEVGSAAGGSLTVLGTATVTTIDVDSRSALSIGNVVGTINNSGTLATLTPESALHISNGLNQPAASSVAAEGTLLVRTNGTTSDTFSAASASLFGTVKVMGVGTHADYTIVTTDPGALTANVVATPSPGGLYSTSSTLFKTTLTNVGDTTLLLSTVQSNLTPFAQTPNEAAVAGAIDKVIQNPPASFVPLLLVINDLNGAAIPDALQQLTPQSYLYMRDIAFENTTFLAQRTDGYLSNLRAGFYGLDTSGLSILGPGFNSSLGQSLGSLLAYNNEGTAPNGVNYYPVDAESPAAESAEPSGPLMIEPSPAGPATISDSVDPRMAPTAAPPASTSVFDGSGSGFNEFISGNVVLGELNQDNSGSNQPHANYVAGNATAGISFRMNSNLAAGVLFDYNHTDALTSAQGSHVRVDSYSPGIFATYFDRGFYANGLFTFGYNNYSDNRNIDLGGAALTANSHPNGEQFAPNIDVGYDFHPLRHLLVGPTAGLGYTHLDVDSFQESGASVADLHVDSQSADSLRGRIGGKAVYVVQAGNVIFQPTLTASYQHEFLNNPYDLESSLDIPGTPSFATRGSNPGRDSGLIGLGVTATFDGSMNLYLNYLAEIGGEDYFVQSIEGGLKASF